MIKKKHYSGKRLNKITHNKRKFVAECIQFALDEINTIKETKNQIAGLRDFIMYLAFIFGCFFLIIALLRGC